MDSSSTVAFPLELDFSNSTTNSFTMTPLSSVPDPSCVFGRFGLLGVGVIGLLRYRRQLA
jgi:hypothetical protein